MIPDKPMRHPPGLGKRIIWMLVLFVVAMLAWSLVGELEVVTSARGRVVTEGQIKSIQAAISSAARVIHVKEGDAVRAGDILITLDDTVFRADVAAVDERIAQLEIELSRLTAESKGQAMFSHSASGLPPPHDDRYAAQLAVQAARLVNLNQREHEQKATLDARRAALANGESALEGQLARLLIVQEKERRAQPYVDIAMPRFQYLQLKDDLLVLERDVAAQRATNRRLAQEIAETNQRLLQIKSSQKQEITQELSDKRSTLAVAEAELAKARKRLADTQIRAPEDGVVQKIMVTTVGASVSPNDVLLQIVPSNTRLIIEVTIPNEEKGYLRTGQSVDIKFDAFPFQKYGRLMGQLEWISPDAELSTNANVSLLTEAAQIRALTSSIPQYVFRGRVLADQASNPRLRLAPGLTAQVDIYTDKRRILDFFLFPLQKTTEEALRVR